MTPIGKTWKPISTHTLNVASVDILNGITIPTGAKGAIITFDSAARVSIGATDASSTFGHLIAGSTSFFVDCLNQIPGTADFITACTPGAAVPPTGHVTFYEVVSNT
jgi:hypothetical protein